MPYPTQSVWIDHMTQWGKARGIEIQKAAISYENYVKSMSAQLLLQTPDVDILWHNDDWGQLFGPYLESMDDVPGIERIAWKYAPDVAFDYGGHRRTVVFYLSADKFFYRTDLMENPPSTWEEMVEISKRLIRENKVKWGLVGGWRYLHTWYSLFWSLWSNNGDVYLPVGERDNKVLNANGWQAGVTAREHIEMMQFWWDNIYTHKICPPGIINYTRMDAQPIFTNGEAAFYADAGSVFVDIKDPAKAKIGGKAYFTLHPVGPSAPFKRWSYGAGWGWSIPAKAPTPVKEAVKEMLASCLSNKQLMKDLWYKGAGVPPVKDAWPELMKEDKDFAAFIHPFVEGEHFVVPAYYFKTWLEAFSTYVDFCTRAVQGARQEIPKVMAELAPRLTQIGKASMT
jgi:maltose-binding protein MalE